MESSTIKSCKARDQWIGGIRKMVECPSSSTVLLKLCLEMKIGNNGSFQSCQIVAPTKNSSRQRESRRFCHAVSFC